jgi:hypothetical protein
MTDQPLVTLAELVAEGFGASVHSGPTIHHLAAQLGDDVVLDDLGRQCVSRDTARRLFTERAAQQERQRAQRTQPTEAQTYQDAVRRGIAARKARQRELLRENPQLSAREVMALAAGDPDSDLERAGRRTDELLTASRRGLAGFAHHFSPNHQKG